MKQFPNTMLSVIVLSGVAFAQCGSKSDNERVALTDGDKNLVQVAVASGQFETLAKALGAAGLVDALQGEGPFTVFAPVDSAFAKLPQEKLTALLQPENKKKLTGILTYHVVPGRLMAKDVVKQKSLTTLEGGRLDVDVQDDGVRIGTARILKTDVLASNGVIHVIDAVLLPQKLPSIVGLAQQTGKFGTLLAAAQAAGLAETLDRDGPFTVFAPTDAAFAEIPESTLKSLLLPENRAKLTAILKLHVVQGEVSARDAVIAGKAPSLSGQKLEFGITDGRLTVNRANIIGSDVRAKNGVVHVIDRVLLPNE